jgi:hypothetical protein
MTIIHGKKNSLIEIHHSNIEQSFPAWILKFCRIPGHLLTHDFLLASTRFVIFNDRVQGFSTFVKTVETGYLLTLGKFQLTLMMQANQYWTIVFHTTFNICMVFIMLQVFMTLIYILALAKAKKEKELLILFKWRSSYTKKLIWRSRIFF